MSQYNFLNGSTIDNFSNFLFDALQSEDSYLGFSRGVPEMQWGISALVYLEHPEVAGLSTFPSSAVAKDIVDSYTSTKFYDLNSNNIIPGTNDTNREVFIGVTANTDTTLTNLTYLDSADIGNLKLSFIGKNWAILEGLSSTYYNFITASASASYYLVNYTKNKSLACKILNKSFVNVPYYTTNCNLYIKKDGESSPSLLKTNLQRTINIIGESYITGLRDVSVIESTDIDYILNNETSAGTQNKTDLKLANFVLKDESGNILIDNMTFVDPEVGNTSEIYTEVLTVGNSSKYLTFKYPYVNDELQYIKFIIGTKQNNELAIWNEVLPFATSIPTSDSNPPGLDVSYLKNPLLSSSIFDVKGISKIQSNEVEFVKELFNQTEIDEFTSYGFDIETIELTGPNSEHLGVVREYTVAGSGSSIIPLNDFHTFVVGDIIQDYAVSGISYTVIGVDYSYGNSSITLNRSIVTDLPKNYVLQSNPSDINARINLAKTINKEKALKYGLYNVLITKDVPLTGVGSPTEDIYRQLFISYKPFDMYGTQCVDNIYRDIFNINTFEYNIGSLLYLSNKIPIYRKWANINEQFKIIL